MQRYTTFFLLFFSCLDIYANFYFPFLFFLVAPTCLHNNDCVQTNGSQYCRYDVGQCGGKGVCVGVPTSCDTDWAPLCSCDGHSYLNPCMAGLNNQSVRYNSICDHQLSTVAGTYFYFDWTRHPGCNLTIC